MGGNTAATMTPCLPSKIYDFARNRETISSCVIILMDKNSVVGGGPPDMVLFESCDRPT